RAEHRRQCGGGDAAARDGDGACDTVETRRAVAQTGLAPDVGVFGARRLCARRPPLGIRRRHLSAPAHQTPANAVVRPCSVPKSLTAGSVPTVETYFEGPPICDSPSVLGLT